MSGERCILSRQWVPIPGGSCDVRMGTNAIASASKVLRDSVSKPHTCVIVVRESMDADVVDELERQAVDAGFACRVFVVEEPVGAVESIPRLAQCFAKARVTADDLCCAVGDVELMSLVSCMCGAWCSSMSVVGVPIDEPAFFEGVLVPQALDVGDTRGLFAVRASIRHALVDLGLMLRDSHDESSRYARALMVGAAMASSEKEFSELWDRAPEIMQDDEDVRGTQLVATAKARGKLAASTAVVVRCGLEYGRTFACAVASLAPSLGPSALLGEGMRFCARLSVALGKLSVDDMLAQDELLDQLGVGMVTCDVNPTELLAALKREKGLRSHRTLWEMPLALGRVRLQTVESAMLEEHVRAWCAAHAQVNLGG